MSNWYAEEFDNPKGKGQESNPFAAGDAWQENQNVVNFDASQSEFRLEGKELVVTSGSSLPPICIKSGRSDELTPVTITLSHSPSWAFLVGGVVLALVFQKKCEITYFINADIAAALRKRRLFGVIGICLAVAVLVAAGLAEQPVVGIIGFLLALASLILLIRGSLGLSISRHKDGTEFWIRGFHKTFFERLEKSVEAI